MDNLSYVLNMSFFSNHQSEKPFTFWMEYIVAIALVKYAMISIVIMGTIGNVISFIVLIRRRMRRNSINIYLAILACADTVVLYISAFKTWLRVIAGFELLHVSNALCKITIFIFMLASHLSAWLIVLVTADRLIVVCFPFRSAKMSTPRGSAVTTILLLCVLILYNLHLLWTMHLHEYVHGYKQYIPQLSNDFMNGPFNYVRLASYTIIPFVLVLGMNIRIIVSICRTTENSPLNTNKIFLRTIRFVTDSNRILRNKRRLTTMLLVVSFSWLFLTLPFTVISLINFKNSTNHRRAIIFLLKTISFLLMYLNHSCNFLLYCFVGKRIRTEFLSVLSDCKLTRQRRPITCLSKNLRTRRTSL